MRYETIPHEVEAMQFTVESMWQIPEFTGSTGFNVMVKDGIFNVLLTVAGVKMLAIQGDYIVKDNGEIFVLKEKEFETNYRKIEEE